VSPTFDLAILALNEMSQKKTKKVMKFREMVNFLRKLLNENNYFSFFIKVVQNLPLALASCLPGLVLVGATLL